MYYCLYYTVLYVYCTVDFKPIGVALQGTDKEQYVLVEMVIKFLLTNLTGSPKDNIVIIRDQNVPQIEALNALNLTERAGFDFENEESLRKAFAGIKRLLLLENLESPMHLCSYKPIKIAEKVGVKHIVYIQFSIDPQLESKTERDAVISVLSFLIVFRNVTYTFLVVNPTYEALMDFTIGSFLREGKYYTQNKNAAVAHVALEDAALVTAKVLANDTFENLIIKCHWSAVAEQRECVTDHQRGSSSGLT